MAVPTVRTVNAKNQSYLAEAASSEAGWRRYLETLSRHTGCANAFYNLSAMNCAGLAASDWHECREILPISTWKSLFPGADIKAAEGCTGVYGVKSRPRGSGGGLFFVDELFPPALLVGLPPTRLRGAARVLDLSVDIAAASWSDAKAGLYRLVNVADMDSDAEAVPEAERVPVAWDDLDENTRFVIEAHFRAQGPGCASPVPPPDDVRAKASSLKGYVNGIVKTAAPLIKQMRSGYRAAFERHRREVIPACDPGGAMTAKEGARLAESRAQAHERRRDGIGRHGRPSERATDDGGEIDVRRPHGRRYRREENDSAGGNDPERHAMRRRRDVAAKPEPEAPPEKYYPHGRPPRETAGHAKSAAARTAKDRGKKKKPPTGKGST